LELATAVREFYAIVEQGEDVIFIGELPQLRACYRQGKTLNEWMADMREVIDLCLEVQGEETGSEVVGIQKVTI
jgi:predicted RNase H-like HicB family nuclease